MLPPNFNFTNLAALRSLTGGGPAVRSPISYPTGPVDGSAPQVGAPGPQPAPVAQPVGPAYPVNPQTPMPQPVGPAFPVSGPSPIAQPAPARPLLGGGNLDNLLALANMRRLLPALTY